MTNAPAPIARYALTIVALAVICGVLLATIAHLLGGSR